MGDEQALAVFGEQHEVGFPMAWRSAIGDVDGSFADRAAELDGAGRTAAALAEASAPGFATREQAMPIVLLRRSMIGETVD